MTLEEKNLVLFEALQRACQFIREKPPTEYPFEDVDMLMILVNGMQRDPQGKEYMAYFIDKAKEELGIE